MPVKAIQLLNSPRINKTGIMHHPTAGEEAKLAGFDKYLVKPLELETLRDWLQEWAAYSV